MLDTATYDPLSPKRIDEIVGNSEIWSTLQKQISSNSASHLVLVGPAGCGKSLFLRLALVGFPTLIIDCTANFGLRDVRESIRIFARGSRTVDGKLRWVIFEHADALTSDAQAFLRRMLETTSGSTRIVFECRDAGAISEPIFSRSSVISVSAPDDTEIIYEVLRRTEFKLDRGFVEQLVAHHFGNMRATLQHALASKSCLVAKDNIQENQRLIEEILSDRPIHDDTGAWIVWASKAEQSCRVKGIDLRNLLRFGWPKNPIVSNICLQWSRLGGTSPRTLFFSCVAQLITPPTAS
jgi:replication-associated recombination protein RarA